MTGLGIPSTDYHSAHKPPAPAAPREVFHSARVAAYRLDITDPIAPFGPGGVFADCDVLVADLPWQKGYATFNQRAGIADGRTYTTFMRAVTRIVETATVPTWLITGQHALRKLPAPDVTLPMRLNEDDALAVGYRPGPEATGRYGIAQEFLHALAQQYQCAGDFCCGYGRTGRFFARAGKRAVLSDFNPQCIGYIADHADQWTTP